MLVVLEEVAGDQDGDGEWTGEEMTLELGSWDSGISLVLSFRGCRVFKILLYLQYAEQKLLQCK